jgi:hypothetical protein
MIVEVKGRAGRVGVGRLTVLHLGICPRRAAFVATSLSVLRNNSTRLPIARCDNS